MKYTRSRDGVRRVNLRGTIRVGKQEVADLTALAKEEGFPSLKKFLDDCLWDGIIAVKARREEDARQREIYGD